MIALYSRDPPKVMHVPPKIIVEISYMTFFRRVLVLQMPDMVLKTIKPYAYKKRTLNFLKNTAISKF